MYLAKHYVVRPMEGGLHRAHFTPYWIHHKNKKTFVQNGYESGRKIIVFFVQKQMRENANGDRQKEKVFVGIIRQQTIQTYGTYI